MYWQHIYISKRNILIPTSSAHIFLIVELKEGMSNCEWRNFVKEAKQNSHIKIGLIARKGAVVLEEYSNSEEEQFELLQRLSFLSPPEMPDTQKFRLSNMMLSGLGRLNTSITIIAKQEKLSKTFIIPLMPISLFSFARKIQTNWLLSWFFCLISHNYEWINHYMFHL